MSHGVTSAASASVSREGEIPVAARPVELAVRVYYEDTDAAGVGYYANYLRVMERARTEWLGALGVELVVLEREHRVVFVVHRVDVEYLRPARLGDRLHVSVAVLEQGRSRLVLDQTIRCGTQTLTRARVSLACLDPVQWRPARIPGELAALIAPAPAQR
jgi:acyl-CoA thioester hydrolase